MSSLHDLISVFSRLEREGDKAGICASALQRDYTHRLFPYQMMDKMAERAIHNASFVRSLDGGSICGLRQTKEDSMRDGTRNTARYNPRFHLFTVFCNHHPRFLPEHIVVPLSNRERAMTVFL